MGNLVLKNIDKIVSGDIVKGILPGDAIEIGRASCRERV